MSKKYNKVPIKIILRGQIYHIKISTTINGQRVLIRESSHSTDRAEAERYANKRLAQLIEDIEFRTNPNKKREYTLDQAFGLYWEEVGQYHSNSDDTFNKIENLTKYFNFNMQLSLLTIEDISKFVKIKREENRKISTINRYLALISAVLNLCKKRRIITPDINIRDFIKREPVQLDKYYTREEFFKIYDVAVEHLQKIMMFDLHTGFRRSNLLNLKWEQIRGEYIHYRVKDKNYEGGRPVTKKITPTVQAILDSLPKCSDYVFTYKGQRIKSIKKAWKTAVMKAGVRYLPPHSIRHTHGTWLYESTKDAIFVQRSLNHTDSKTTLRYIHAVDNGASSVYENTFGTNLAQNQRMIN